MIHYTIEIGKLIVVVDVVNPTHYLLLLQEILMKGYGLLIFGHRSGILEDRNILHSKSSYTGNQSWRVTKHVRSNAIVYAKGNKTIGIGAGQMSRVDSVQLAAKKALRSLKGTVMASDAFFPFRDGIDEAANAGITAVIQPGGSIRDDEVIQSVDEHGMAMVLTGVRHFRHA